MLPRPPGPRPPQRFGLWKGLGIWAFAGLAMGMLDGHVDLANLAMLLVLASVVAALWLPPAASWAACAAAVLAFNWTLVPPRRTFSVDLQQHALLLLTMWGVSSVVAWLMARLRAAADGERAHAERAEALRAAGDALRDTDDPLDHARALRDALAAQVGGDVRLLLLRTGALPASDDPAAVRVFGPAGVSTQAVGDTDADAIAGLWLALRSGHALGPGTGRHEEQDAWFLPMRGRTGSHGAARLALPGAPRHPARSPATRLHAQALCDQFGLAMERAAMQHAAEQARAEAAAQSLRNTLLSAIAHDHRTPLATITGAASSLHEQAERLSPAQRLQLAATILDEAERLRRLTDNTLQLARLDAPGVTLQLDWESAEELVGSVLRRVRRRAPARRVHARVDPGLPLLRCDAVLVVQLLENLVENALRYSPEDAPVEIVARQAGDALLLSVADRGPGIAAAQRERLFERFQRGADLPATGPGATGAVPRGLGLGLAVCRAIARAHGGRITVHARRRGGSRFECALPLVAAPAQPVDPAAPAPLGDPR